MTTRLEFAEQARDKVESDVQSYLRRVESYITEKDGLVREKETWKQILDQKETRIRELEDEKQAQESNVNTLNEFRDHLNRMLLEQANKSAKEDE